MPKIRKKTLLFRLFRHKNAPKRDEFGRSQRQMCFEMFDEGTPWEEVADANKVKPETCRRYYQNWKKLPRGFEPVYKLTIVALKNAETREIFEKAMAKKLRLTPEEIQQILLRPWGLRSLLLARFGVKKVNPTISESDKAAMIRMDKFIRASGKTPEEFIQQFDFLVGVAKEIKEKSKKSHRKPVKKPSTFIDLKARKKKL